MRPATRNLRIASLPAILACSTRPDSADPNETGGGSSAPVWSEATLQLDDGTDLVRHVDLWLRIVDDWSGNEEQGMPPCSDATVFQTWDSDGLHVGDPSFAELDVGSATRSIEGWWVHWWDGTGDGHSYTHQWLGTYTIEDWASDRIVLTMSDGTACLFEDTNNCWPANGTLTIDGEVAEAPKVHPSEAAWFDPASGELLCGGIGDDVEPT